MSVQDTSPAAGWAGLLDPGEAILWQGRPGTARADQKDIVQLDTGQTGPQAFLEAGRARGMYLFHML